LAQARAEKKSEAPISEVSIETVVTSPTYSVEQLSKAEKKIAVLESALQAEKQTSAKLLKMLEAEKEKCDRLSDELDAQMKHSRTLQQTIRVERRARQRGQIRKTYLEQQIRIFNSADSKRASDLKTITTKASATVEALMKVERENSILQNQLSKALQTFTVEAVQSQQKLSQTGKKLKECRALAIKLKKRCERATAVKDNAVRRAKEQAQKQHNIHKLLHKGVYTENTRNLVRLLVQAGCSREHVSRIIHATLKTAGIITKGSISRRTVSRIITEGYYAAQMQLGYEMKVAGSGCNILFFK